MGRLASAIAVAVIGSVLWTGCDRTPTAHSPGPSRPAAFVRCADVLLATVPPGFRKTNAQLQALAGNHMGAVITYSNGRQRIKTSSGIDALDALDDVDLTSSHLRAGGNDFTLYRTTVFPGLLIAQLENAPGGKPCDDVFVQSSQLPVEQFVSILGGVSLREAK